MAAANHLQPQQQIQPPHYLNVAASSATPDQQQVYNAQQLQVKK
jgi:hypothetical protein